MDGRDSGDGGRHCVGDERVDGRNSGDGGGFQMETRAWMARIRIL